MSEYTRADLMALARRVTASSDKTDRPTCLLSFDERDLRKVADFIRKFGAGFIAKAAGVTQADPFIRSEDDDYLAQQVAEKYLSDVDVTIVLIGACTWSRKFVDWEIAASLRSGVMTQPRGLVAYRLPGASLETKTPYRVMDNDGSFAAVHNLPSSGAEVRGRLADAIARAETHKPENTRHLRKRNSSC